MTLQDRCKNAILDAEQIIEDAGQEIADHVSSHDDLEWFREQFEDIRGKLLDVRIAIVRIAIVGGTAMTLRDGCKNAILDAEQIIEDAGREIDDHVSSHDDLEWLREQFDDIREKLLEARDALDGGAAK